MEIKPVFSSTLKTTFRRWLCLGGALPVWPCVLKKFREYENRYLLGRSVAKTITDLMQRTIQEKGRVRKVFTSAMSQTDFLKYIGEEKDIDWTKVYAFHLDHKESFSRFLEDRLFSNVGEVNFNPINSEAKDPDEECRRYANLMLQDD